MTTATEQAQLSELLCAGCREQVSPEPPAGEPGEGWSHRDGSGLCRPPAGGPGEPIEWPEHQH